MEAVGSSKAFFDLLKAAGVAIPPRCRKVTIEAEIRQPLVVRFGCFGDRAESPALAAAVKELESDAEVIVVTVPRVVGGFERPFGNNVHSGEVDVTKVESP